MKIPAVGDDCSMPTDRGAEGRTDGQTDMMKLIVAFHNFAKAPTIYDTTRCFP